jgi:hypothetical protein
MVEKSPTSFKIKPVLAGGAVPLAIGKKSPDTSSSTATGFLLKCVLIGGGIICCFI